MEFGRGDETRELTRNSAFTNGLYDYFLLDALIFKAFAHYMASSSQKRPVTMIASDIASR